MKKLKIAAVASILGLSAAAGSANAFWWGGPGGFNNMWDNFFDSFGNMDFHMDGGARGRGYGYGYGYPYYGYYGPWANPYLAGPYATPYYGAPVPYGYAPVAPSAPQAPQTPETTDQSA